MAKTQTCECGQVLDIEDFQPGEQIQCPSCDAILTIPAAQPAVQAAAEPVVAMAAPAEDDEADIQASAHATAQQYISPLKRRQQAERRSRYASQAQLKKFLVWPSLVLGLASLGVAAMGIMWALEEKPINIVNENGFDIVQATIETKKGSGVFERINVKPNLVPATELVPVHGGREPRFNGAALRASGQTYIVLSDAGKAWLKENPGRGINPITGYFIDPTEKDLIIEHFAKVNANTDAGNKKKGFLRLMQSGFWLYEVDEENKPIRKRPDVTMYAQLAGSGYAIVKYHGPDDFRTLDGSKVSLAYYKAEDEDLIEQLGDFKLPSAPMGMDPAFFIWSGAAIGMLLMAAGAFFAYEVYFSKAAKAAREKRQAEEAAQQAAA